MVVGLGNPGPEYEATRHNVGFMAVDRLRGVWAADAWSLEARFEARVVRAMHRECRVWLVQPLTYMNASGDAVGRLIDFYRLPVQRLLVVSDDADLDLGCVRLRGQGSSGGHHGLDSIERRIGTRDFARLRVGIGRNTSPVREITGHVLGRFRPADRGLLDLVLDRVARQVECWIDHGLQKAMNQFNGTVASPEET